MATTQGAGVRVLEIDDGEQTRPLCYIDDCVEGIFRLMRSDHHQPLNLGQDRLIPINVLADLVAEGLARTYPWIEEQVSRALVGTGAPSAAAWAP